MQFIRKCVGAQLQSCVRLFVTSWIAALQASLSFTISWSLLKFMSTELAMLPNHLILCLPFLLLASVFPSVRVFLNELALHIRWPKYWSFSFSTSPSNEYSRLIYIFIYYFSDHFSIQIVIDYEAEFPVLPNKSLLVIRMQTVHILCPRNSASIHFSWLYLHTCKMIYYIVCNFRKGNKLNIP